MTESTDGGDGLSSAATAGAQVPPFPRARGVNGTILRDPKAPDAGDAATRATATSAPGDRIGRYRWRICALLFFATTLNYLDRQVLGILAPELQRAFAWSDTDYAAIAAAFKVAYAVGLVTTAYATLKAAAMAA